MCRPETVVPVPAVVRTPASPAAPLVVVDHFVVSVVVDVVDARHYTRQIPRSPVARAAKRA